MLHSTGSGHDRFEYRPYETDIDRWEDSGGIDTLVLFEWDPGARRVIHRSSDSLVVKHVGARLDIPNDSLGQSSVEYVEYRQLTTDPSDTPLLSVLKVVTHIHDLPHWIDGGPLETNVLLVDGGRGNQIILPQVGFDLDGFSEIHANRGDDEITLSPFVDVRVFGGHGDDTIMARGDSDNFISGGVGRDRLRGAAGDDTIYGGRGSDTIRGRDGDDWIAGDPSFPLFIKGRRDVLIGGRGDDTLQGGHDRDQLKGGAGEDVFWFTLASFGNGPDVVLDFNAFEDNIYLDTDTRPGRIKVRAEDGDTYLSFKPRGDDEFDFAILEGVELERSEIDFGF